LTSFERFICERERELVYLIFSFILSQCRDSRIGVAMKFRSFGDSMRSRVEDFSLV